MRIFEKLAAGHTVMQEMLGRKGHWAATDTGTELTLGYDPRVSNFGNQFNRGDPPNFYVSPKSFAET